MIYIFWINLTTETAVINCKGYFYFDVIFIFNVLPPAAKETSKKMNRKYKELGLIVKNVEGYNLMKLKVNHCKGSMLLYRAKVDMKMNNWYQLCFDQCGNYFKVNTVTSNANIYDKKTIVFISNFPSFHVKGNYFVLIFYQHSNIWILMLDHWPEIAQFCQQYILSVYLTW